MTIVRALDEGICGEATLLYTKLIMGGFASVILASACGLSLLFSSIPMLLYQGGLTVFAGFFHELARSSPPSSPPPCSPWASASSC